MKILAICSSIDLSLPGGGIPIWWQMLKSIHEVGAEVIVIPCWGKSFTSPWWRNYQKPFIQNKTFDFAQNRGIMINKKLSRHLYEREWRKNLEKIFMKEENIDIVFLLGVPYLAEKIPSWIRSKFQTPTAYYESDIQNIPKYSLDHRPEKHRFPDYSECDAVLCSFEKTSQELKERGIQHVWTVPFGADPTIFTPIELKQDIDVFFSGYGSLDREDWMRQMITLPSNVLKDTMFLIEGSFNINLGAAKRMHSVSLDQYKHFCRRSKINLNILRQQFILAGVLNSRIFELASLECCIVSNPCASIKQFFEPNKEVIIVNNQKEAIETYKWLISSEDERVKIGKAARQRILKEHTYWHRAKASLDIFRKLTLSH